MNEYLTSRSSLCLIFNFDGLLYQSIPLPHLILSKVHSLKVENHGKVKN